MRRVVAAGAGALVLAAVAAVGAHARTVPASSGHRWCAERADTGVESPASAVSLVVGVGIETGARTPNAFVCWSNSANAEVVRAWASPRDAVAGVECASMRGSRTDVRCPHAPLRSPVDDDRRKAAQVDELGGLAAADATSDAVQLDISLPGVCVASPGRDTCTDGYRATASVTHRAHVATGDDECRLEPGKRCLVGGGAEPDADAKPRAEADAGVDESAEPATVEIPESE